MNQDEYNKAWDDGFSRAITIVHDISDKTIAEAKKESSPETNGKLDILCEILKEFQKAVVKS